MRSNSFSGFHRVHRQPAGKVHVVESKHIQAEARRGSEHADWPLSGQLRAANRTAAKWTRIHVHRNKNPCSNLEMADKLAHGSFEKYLERRTSGRGALKSICHFRSKSHLARTG